MSTPPREEDPISWRNAWRVAFSICIVMLFLNDKPLLAIRFIGLQIIWQSYFLLKNPAFPYGWKGRPASGYITGTFAKALAIIFGSIGLALLFKPALVDFLYVN